MILWVNVGLSFLSLVNLIAGLRLGVYRFDPNPLEAMFMLVGLGGIIAGTIVMFYAGR